MDERSLVGSWDFRFDGETTWQPIAVPGCWEALGGAKDDSGLAWYRTTIHVPAAWAGRRAWLRFGAASYHCIIWVNGREVGQHTGLWDSFSVEIGAAAPPGSAAEVLVRVEKPASLQDGPASPAVAGRFPLKTTLAGFLPYVWGHMFGGIWQDVTLASTGAAFFTDVYVRGSADGHVRVEATLSAPRPVLLELRDPAGTLLHTATLPTTAHENGAIVTHAVALPDPRPWQPDAPALYHARLQIADGDERTVRFGMRSVGVDGSTLTLNGQPVYPRMALSWGWYPQALHSNPGPAQVREDFAKLRSLGYNGVKLCLWFPPAYYFDLADELGMLLWVELPMWLPEPNAFFREQTPREYGRLVRQARQHPAVILYSLGCELNAQADGDLLEPLFRLVKDAAGDALVRDNSGSGEAFGGLLAEYAEYYDYHFYSELQHFRALLEYFSPRWRPEKPWLFGEFCDMDTFRDPRSIEPAPWWLAADPAVNPPGARWQMDAPQQLARLQANGMAQRSAELTRVSAEQALLHRKYTLELSRSFREIGGYVVTGEADTPITTAGMWTEDGVLKFAPEQFRAFNADTVLLLGWDKRRMWAGGGDRAGRWDTWNYHAGALIRPHLIVSQYGAARGPAHTQWSIAFDDAAPWAAGEHVTAFDVTPGMLRELAVAEFRAPDVAAPRRATLRASVQIGDNSAENSWPIWCYPCDPWRNVPPFGLEDPAGRLHDLPALLRHPLESHATQVIVATSWTPMVEQWVAGGGRAVLLQHGTGTWGPLPTRELPFWREAMRLVEPHAAWGDFPHAGAGLQFFGCATDHALDLANFTGAAWPILRRIDTRTMYVHEYVVELAYGAGRVIVSTLRLQGGQGEQPTGLARNTAAAYMLAGWIRYLATGVL